MTSGAWFVLFPKSKTPRRDVVLAKLREVRGATVTSHGDAFEFTVTVGSASFDVALNVEAYVNIETREAVARNRESLANADEVARYDARFELLHDQRDMGTLFNPLLSAAERLAELTSGVVYESDNGVFQ